MTAVELSEKTGLSRHAIYSRMKRGETDQALIAPLHERKKFCVQADTIVAP